MKPLLALLAILMTFAGGASAQTLKWTIPLPPSPAGTTQYAVNYYCSDTAGNSVFLIYCGTPSAEVGTQIFWVNSAGKTLDTSFIPGALNGANILSVSASVVLLEIRMSVGGNMQAFLRKITKRGNKVSFVDTPMPTQNTVLHLDTFDVGSRANFFVVGADITFKPLSISRYTVK